jgi:hypothetical protein
MKSNPAWPTIKQQIITVIYGATKDAKTKADVKAGMGKALPAIPAMGLDFSPLIDLIWKKIQEKLGGGSGSSSGSSSGSTSGSTSTDLGDVIPDIGIPDVPGLPDLGMLLDPDKRKQWIEDLTAYWWLSSNEITEPVDILSFPIIPPFIGFNPLTARFSIPFPLSAFMYLRNHVQPRTKEGQAQILGLLIGVVFWMFILMLVILVIFKLNPVSWLIRMIRGL